MNNDFISSPRLMSLNQAITGFSYLGLASNLALLISLRKTPLAHSFENIMIQSFFLSNAVSNLSNSFLQNYCHKSGFIQQLGNLGSQLAMLNVALKYASIFSTTAKRALLSIWTTIVLLILVDIFNSSDPFENTVENLCGKKFNEFDMIWTIIEMCKIFSAILTFALSLMILYATFTDVKLMAQKKKNSFIKVFIFLAFDSILAMTLSCANIYHSLGFKSDKKIEIVSVLSIHLSRTLAAPLLFFAIHNGVQQQLLPKKKEASQPSIISSSLYTIDTKETSISDVGSSDDQLGMNVMVHSASFDMLNAPRVIKKNRYFSEDELNMARIRKSSFINTGKFNQKDYRGKVLLSEQFKAALNSTKMRNDSSNDSLPS